MTTTTSNPAADTATSPGDAFRDVLGTTVAALSTKIDDWTDRLNSTAGGSGAPPSAADHAADDLAEGGGAGQQAGVRGLQAGLTGKNPIWAAIKGAWTGGSPAVKAAVITAGVAVILLLVLSPVLLVVLLVTVPILVVVSRVRSART